MYSMVLYFGRKKSDLSYAGKGTNMSRSRMLIVLAEGNGWKK